ncbi:UNVERIFIED_CONTAM: hypothetical protein Slati_1714100 [Sesamum latifolium]|uniref:Uncharacterized protein n=1 Tax=Sesamum latifolium TaxID=2727402 RepID=A0AAW2WZN7_9LAMI
MWIGANGCEDTIRNCWTYNNTSLAGDRMMECIRNTRVGLLHWEKTNFRRIKGEVEDLEKRLDQLAKAPLSREAAQQRVSLCTELEAVLTKKKSCGSRREKPNGYKKVIGTQPIFILGLVLVIRRMQFPTENRLGQWCVSVDEMQRTILEQFETLFRRSNPREEDISAALEGMQARVSADMKTSLIPWNK